MVKLIKGADVLVVSLLFVEIDKFFFGRLFDKVSGEQQFFE
jgi:hypothetical protein